MAALLTATRMRALITALAVAVPIAGVAFAQSYEQIQQSCRDQLRPQVQSCVKGRAGMDRQAAIAECKNAASGAMRSCVLRETQRAAGNKAAPPPPKADKGPAATKGTAGMPSALAAPPRTIADIAAILDAEKPDPEKIAKLRAAAEMAPPNGLSPSHLAQFYYDRGNARALLVRNKEALADGLKALDVGKGRMDVLQTTRIRQFVAIQHMALGNYKEALAVGQVMMKESLLGGQLVNARHLSRYYASVGDAAQAEAYANRVAALIREARGSPHPLWRETYPIYGTGWESDADDARATVFEMRGQFREAEAAYVRAEAFRRASLKDLPRMAFPPPPEQVIHIAERILLHIARVKARQGFLSAAEADARRALLGMLKSHGKYHPNTTKFIVGLADILIEQGRYPEAERLMRTGLDVQQQLGIADQARETASIIAQLGSVLLLQGQNDEASTIYERLERAVATWEPRAREVLLLDGSRIAALYAAGQIPAGIAAAEQLVKRERARVGERHVDTTSARGMVALGYALARRDAEAIREFREVVPTLMAASIENANDDDPTVVAARRQRLQRIVEAFIDVLARSQGEAAQVAAETFALADAIRGRTVQQALASSSARMLAQDPALADLVRREQDYGKQINAYLGSLNNALALPSGERDEGVVRAINATVDKLREERGKARQEINLRFPAYAELIDPRPPSIEQIKTVLRPGEALLSFYFGQRRSFAWAVPREGGVAFVSLPMTALELEAAVRRLRATLDPQAETIEEMPAFDLKAAFDLYQRLLAPTAGAWREAKSLVVVTNGALGLLPLSLLPAAEPPAEVVSNVAFDGYRAVPWLARTHAVSQVPSVAALRTLRQLPAGSRAREPLIGFGDPFFSLQQAAEAERSTPSLQVAEATSRGIRLERRATPKTSEIDSAELAQLPRLPDTADELRSVAIALGTNPAKALHLGRNASEGRVKEVDLTRYKVVAFSTHGLVPGELNGLTQPALALSAPSVADSDGDGLLTMDEILALKLDADWVVLSACNTAAGAGAGAEAASGLGRAFFYAGTRALVVTNWSVHSASATDLVSELFSRQAKDPDLARAEALRQAMMALVDGGGWRDDSGKVVFTYAHPMFWAPYSIIGDGGQT